MEFAEGHEKSLAENPNFHYTPLYYPDIYRVRNLTSHDKEESENNPETPHLGEIKRMRKQCVPGASPFFARAEDEASITAVEGLKEVEMGIDVAMWRAGIGLNYYHQSRYACRPLSVKWRAARWGMGEVMNSTPLLLQGCMAVVSLSLILGHTFRRRPIGMADTGVIGVCLLLGVCAVVLALLLMAGDVERNPGPTGKEGR